MGGGWRGRGNYGLSTDLNGFPRGTKTAFKEEGGTLQSAQSRASDGGGERDLIASPLSGVPRARHNYQPIRVAAQAMPRAGLGDHAERRCCPAFEGNLSSI